MTVYKVDMFDLYQGIKEMYEFIKFIL